MASQPTITFRRVLPRVRGSGAGVVVTPEVGAIVAVRLAPGAVLRIKAVAGAGKSTVLQEYARRHPHQRTVYLVFNRSVRRDQAQAYATAGLRHVEVQTLDKLAFERTRDVHGGTIATAVAAEDGGAAVDTTVSNFLRSADDTLAEHHLPPDLGRDEKTRIRAAAAKVWADMCTGARRPSLAACTKIFQMRAPMDDAYDLVLLDEAHDATPAQLRSVLNLPGAKIVVYDPAQAINGWRGAGVPDVLEAIPAAHVLPLSQTWRYGQAVAELAARALYVLDDDGPRSTVIRPRPGRTTAVRSFGAGGLVPALHECSRTGGRVGVLARTNADLLARAYELLTQHPDMRNRLCFKAGGPFAFVGGDSPTEAVKALVDFVRGWLDAEDPRPLVRDLRHFVRCGADPVGALRSWVEASRGDAATMWAKALFLVDHFGPERLLDIVDSVEACLRDDYTSTGVITFATIHSSKGLSWPSVLICEDWERRSGPAEARLCYVALTRAESVLWIAEPLHGRLMPHTV